MSKAKLYLQQIRKMDIIIDQRLKERDELRDFDGVTAIAYDKDPVQTSPNGSAPFEHTIEKLIELDAKIDALIDEYVTTKNRIIGEIQSLDNANHIDLLYKRYVEYKSFGEIAKEMNYEYYWVCRMHGYALQEFEQKYKQHKQTQIDL